MEREETEPKPFMFYQIKKDRIASQQEASIQRPDEGSDNNKKTPVTYGLKTSGSKIQFIPKIKEKVTMIGEKNQNIIPAAVQEDKSKSDMFPKQKPETREGQSPKTRAEPSVRPVFGYTSEGGFIKQEGNLSVKGTDSSFMADRKPLEKKLLETSKTVQTADDVFSEPVKVQEKLKSDEMVTDDEDEAELQDKNIRVDSKRKTEVSASQSPLQDKNCDKRSQIKESGFPAVPEDSDVLGKVFLKESPKTKEAADTESIIVQDKTHSEADKRDSSNDFISERPKVHKETSDASTQTPEQEQRETSLDQDQNVSPLKEKKVSVTNIKKETLKETGLTPEKPSEIRGREVSTSEVQKASAKDRKDKLIKTKDAVDKQRALVQDKSEIMSFIKDEQKELILKHPTADQETFKTETINQINISIVKDKTFKVSAPKDIKPNREQVQRKVSVKPTKEETESAADALTSKEAAEQQIRIKTHEGKEKTQTKDEKLKERDEDSVQLTKDECFPENLSEIRGTKAAIKESLKEKQKLAKTKPDKKTETKLVTVPDQTQKDRTPREPGEPGEPGLTKVSDVPFFTINVKEPLVEKETQEKLHRNEEVVQPEGRTSTKQTLMKLPETGEPTEELSDRKHLLTEVTETKQESESKLDVDASKKGPLMKMRLQKLPKTEELKEQVQSPEVVVSDREHLIKEVETKQEPKNKLDVDALKKGPLMKMKRFQKVPKTEELKEHVQSPEVLVSDREHLIKEAETEQEPEKTLDVDALKERTPMKTKRFQKLPKTEEPIKHVQSPEVLVSDKEHLIKEVETDQEPESKLDVDALKKGPLMKMKKFQKLPKTEEPMEHVPSLKVQVLDKKHLTKCAKTEHELKKILDVDALKKGPLMKMKRFQKVPKTEEPTEQIQSPKVLVSDREHLIKEVETKQEPENKLDVDALKKGPLMKMKRFQKVPKTEELKEQIQSPEVLVSDREHLIKEAETEQEAKKILDVDALNERTPIKIRRFQKLPKTEEPMKHVQSFKIQVSDKEHLTIKEAETEQEAKKILDVDALKERTPMKTKRFQMLPKTEELQEQVQSPEVVVSDKEHLTKEVETEQEPESKLDVDALKERTPMKTKRFQMLPKTEELQEQVQSPEVVVSDKEHLTKEVETEQEPESKLDVDALKERTPMKTKRFQMLPKTEELQEQVQSPEVVVSDKEHLTKEVETEQEPESKLDVDALKERTPMKTKRFQMLPKTEELQEQVQSPEVVVSDKEHLTKEVETEQEPESKLDVDALKERTPMKTKRFQMLPKTEELQEQVQSPEVVVSDKEHLTKEVETEQEPESKLDVDALKERTPMKTKRFQMLPKTEELQEQVQSPEVVVSDKEHLTKEVETEQEPENKLDVDALKKGPLMKMKRLQKLPKTEEPTEQIQSPEVLVSDREHLIKEAETEQEPENKLDVDALKEPGPDKEHHEEIQTAPATGSLTSSRAEQISVLPVQEEEAEKTNSLQDPGTDPEWQTDNQLKDLRQNWVKKKPKTLKVLEQTGSRAPEEGDLICGKSSSEDDVLEKSPRVGIITKETTITDISPKEAILVKTTEDFLSKKDKIDQDSPHEEKKVRQEKVRPESNLEDKKPDKRSHHEPQKSDTSNKVKEIKAETEKSSSSMGPTRPEKEQISAEEIQTKEVKDGNVKLPERSFSKTPVILNTNQISDKQTKTEDKPEKYEVRARISGAEEENQKDPNNVMDRTRTTLPTEDRKIQQEPEMDFIETNMAKEREEFKIISKKKEAAGQTKFNKTSEVVPVKTSKAHREEDQRLEESTKLTAEQSRSVVLKHEYGNVFPSDGAETQQEQKFSVAPVMEVASERSQVVVDEESQTLQRYDRPEESLKTITPHHISVDYKEPLKDLIPERVRTKHQTEKTPEQLKEDGQQSQSEPEAPRAPETKIRDQQSEKSKMLEGQKVDKDSKTLQQEVQSKTETVKDEYGQISSFSPETEQEQYERGSVGAVMEVASEKYLLAEDRHFKSNTLQRFMASDKLMADAETTGTKTYKSVKHESADRGVGLTEEGVKGQLTTEKISFIGDEIQTGSQPKKILTKDYVTPPCEKVKVREQESDEGQAESFQVIPHTVSPDVVSTQQETDKTASKTSRTAIKYEELPTTNRKHLSDTTQRRIPPDGLIEQVTTIKKAICKPVDISVKWDKSTGDKIETLHQIQETKVNKSETKVESLPGDTVTVKTDPAAVHLTEGAETKHRLCRGTVPSVPEVICKESDKTQEHYTIKESFTVPLKQDITTKSAKVIDKEQLLITPTRREKTLHLSQDVFKPSVTDQTEVKTSGYTTHTSTSTSRKQEPDHIQPILQDSDHIRPILQDSDHIRPILQDSDHIRPILQDSDHIRPILQESDHIRPTIQDSDHIQPILQESDHIRPILLQESDHIRSLLPQEQKAIKPEDQRIEAASEGLFFQEASRGTEGESVTEHMFLI
ncbi:titin-like [Kryptolebias marmoratus]|uniref:titin-like n=1 Tax=Kryptolebias marmoratus TaxID=37003 RepID=UPI0018ACE19A|nr:titin-like [Kryptolebias marmoratus]